MSVMVMVIIQRRVWWWLCWRRRTVAITVTVIAVAMIFMTDAYVASSVRVLAQLRWWMVVGLQLVLISSAAVMAVINAIIFGRGTLIHSIITSAATAVMMVLIVPTIVTVTG